MATTKSNRERNVIEKSKQTIQIIYSYYFI